MKRRNQSARTVITADSYVRADELVIPPEIAQNLTMPILVSKFNIHEIQKIVDEGKANYVIKADKTTRINLKYACLVKGTSIEWGDRILRNGITLNPHSTFGIKGSDFNLQEGDMIIREGCHPFPAVLPIKKKYLLEVGDTVERWLKEGDVTIFNQRIMTIETGSCP